jgi:hypothetical protein
MLAVNLFEYRCFTGIAFWHAICVSSIHLNAESMEGKVKRPSRTHLLLAVAIPLVLQPINAQATEVQFQAVIRQLIGDTAFLGPSIFEGATISGSFSFDPSTPDLASADPDTGTFRHFIADGFHFRVDFGPHSVSTLNLFDIQLINDSCFPNVSCFDRYVIQPANFDAGALGSDIRASFTLGTSFPHPGDPGSDFIGPDEPLPPSPPFDEAGFKNLNIVHDTSGSDDWAILATLTSVTITDQTPGAVPEPGIAWLLGVGLIGFAFSLRTASRR